MTKCVLGDLMEVTRGASLAGKYYATAGDKIRLTLANFDYANNCFKPDTSKDNVFYTQAVDDRFVLKEGDIITPLTEQTPGLLGTTARIPESGKYIQSQDVALLKPFTEKLDPDYCFYLVSSKAVRNQLGAMSQQTKIRHSSPDKIKSCTVFLPELEKQRRIGAFLSTIDRKIALNRKRIATLEAMAKEIYDYWFVQFDFPDAHGRPYKSSGGAMVYNPDLKREIPKGWEVVPLGELISVCNGKDHKALSVGRIPVYGSGGIMRRVDQMLYEGESVLIPRKGTLNNIMYVNGPLWCIDTMFYTKPKVDNVMKYIFMTIKDWDFASMDTGSAVPSMTAGIINKLLVARPADVFLEKFENQLRPLFLGMSLSEREIAKLTSLRDFLLPVLMNGQVKAG